MDNILFNELVPISWISKVKFAFSLFSISILISTLLVVRLINYYALESLEKVISS